MKKNKFWLKDIEVKKMCSDRNIVSNMIIDIGKNILNDMLLKKYNNEVNSNN
jgi:hypothetical protein